VHAVISRFRLNGKSCLTFNINVSTKYVLKISIWEGVAVG